MFSFTLSLLIYIGSTTIEIDSEFLGVKSFSTESCPQLNLTEFNFTTSQPFTPWSISSTEEVYAYNALEPLYSVSYAYYFGIGVSTGLVFGILVSAITSELLSSENYR